MALADFIGSIYREIIIGDVLNNTTAAAVSAAYPDLFPLASDVPAYLTTCSRELLLGASATNQDLADRVSEVFGEADIPNDAGIFISEAAAESINVEDSSEIDETGAEYGILMIVSRIDPPTDPVIEARVLDGAILAMDLRIRWLIHHGAREKRGLSGWLPIPSGPQTIDRNFGIVTSFLKYGKRTHALEMVSLYKAEYVRVFV